MALSGPDPTALRESCASSGSPNAATVDRTCDVSRVRVGQRVDPGVRRRRQHAACDPAVTPASAPESRRQNVGSLADSEGVAAERRNTKRPVHSQSGAPGWNRTSDTRFRKPVLYPLSYEGIVPICRGFSSATAGPEYQSCEKVAKFAGNLRRGGRRRRAARVNPRAERACGKGQLRRLAGARYGREGWASVPRVRSGSV